MAAAGNNAPLDNDANDSYPSNYDNPNIIAVAATTRHDSLASFSNYGLTTVDLGAPGQEILSTTRGSNYGTKSGTSMATPHVSGACALVWAVGGGAMAHSLVKAAIIDAVDPLPALAGKCVSGGRLNVKEAVDVVAVGRYILVVTPNGGEGAEVGGTLTITWNAYGGSWQPADEVEIEYSTDSGSGWDPVSGASNLDYNLRAFEWDTTGLTPGSDYLIRITAVPDPSINDVSDAVFAITGPLDHFGFAMHSSQGDGRAVTGICMVTARDDGGRTITTFGGFNTAGRFPVTITAPDVTVGGLSGGGNELGAPDFINGAADLTGLGMTIVAATTPTTVQFTAASADAKTGLSGSVTIETLPEYLTQLFDPETFDLANRSIIFVPNGSIDFYAAYSVPIVELPTDPAGGTALRLSDDSYASVTLASGAQVSLYGTSYGAFYVGSNGYITFGSGDGDWTESLSDHFDLPRISGLFDDFYPSSGQVTWKQLSDRAAVTFSGVREWGTTNSSTFQIEMFFDGRIVLSYLAIAAQDGLVGLSRGVGVPEDFVETDLSELPQPPGRSIIVGAPNGGEGFLIGTVVAVSWNTFGGSWQPGDKVRLEYSTNEGSDWNLIFGAESLEHDLGTFGWDTTGQTRGHEYRVRVIFLDDPTVYDTSNQNFSLVTDRQLTIIAPNGGELVDINSAVSIVWHAGGADWEPGDRVNLEYSADAGSVWTEIAGAEALPYDDGPFTWSTTQLTGGDRYRVRVSWVTDPATNDASDDSFILRTAHYVNDTSTTNDEWCTAGGDDGNDGLGPPTPKATVQAVLSTYNLEPGDIIRIDTGTYTLSANIEVTSGDQGSTEAPVTFEASPYGVTIDRAGTGSGSYGWYINGAKYVTITTAAGAMHPDAPRSWMTVAGGYDGFYLNDADDCVVSRVVACGNLSRGIYAYGSDRVTYVHNVIHGNGGDGIHLYHSDYNSLTNNTIVQNQGNQIYISYSSSSITVRNNVIWANGPADHGIYCYSAGYIDISDYNLIRATNQAYVGYYNGSHPTLADWQGATGKDTNSLSVDPLFADSDNGDYHLRSHHGRWSPAANDGAGGWVIDDAASPAIDAGDPESDYSDEPQPDGFRMNMGAYGNTPQASKNVRWNILGDTTGDCRADILDMIHIRNHLNEDVGTDDNWKCDVTSDGKIDILDMLFVRYYLGTACSE